LLWGITHPQPKKVKQHPVLRRTWKNQTIDFNGLIFHFIYFLPRAYSSSTTPQLYSTYTIILLSPSYILFCWVILLMITKQKKMN
jgi:hypothetical protein